jgi:hypothetical protein
MAINTYNITSNPGMAWLQNNAGFHQTVTVAASATTVNCYADSLGVNLLASVAPGTSANFDSYGGFFYESTVTSYATVVSASLRLANLTTFTPVNTTATETVAAQIKLPANILFNSAAVKVKYQITCSGVTGTPTLQGALYLGPNGTTADTALISATTTAILANGIQTGEFLLSVQAAPSSASAVVGTGSYSLAGAAGQAVSNATLAATNFATNGVLYLSGTIKWSASSASNSAAFTVFEVELV